MKGDEEVFSLACWMDLWCGHALACREAPSSPNRAFSSALRMIGSAFELSLARRLKPISEHY